MKYLVDSNVISEIRKNKPHGAVLAWLDGVRAEDLFLPAIVVGELQAGAEITRRQDHQKAAALDAWIDEVARTWQVIPMDAAIAREWGILMEGQSKALFEDAMIAATARAVRLVVVTRNVKDFSRFGVQILDPFQNNPTIHGADQVD